MTTRQNPKDDIASLTRRVIAPLRIATNLDEILCEALEIDLGQLADLLADPRSTSLTLLFRLANAAGEIGEQLRSEHGWTDEAFWTARQQLDDRVYSALGGTPAPVARDAEVKPALSDDEIADVAADVAATLRLRDAGDRRELTRQASAARRSRDEYKRELAETGVRLALASIDTPQFVRLGRRWVTDREGRKRLVRPRELGPEDQRGWLRSRAKLEAIGVLRGELPASKVSFLIAFDETAHSEAGGDALDVSTRPAHPWEEGAPDGPLEVLTGDEEHPDLVAGVRPLTVKFDASPDQLEALRNLPSTVLELFQHATPTQQPVLLARADPDCHSWEDADRLLGKPSGHSRDVARKIRRKWLPPEWGDPETDL